MGLSEPAWSYPGTEFGLPRMGNRDDVKIADRLVFEIGIRAAAGQQPKEIRLAGAVRAEHCDPIAEPDLAVERLHEPGQLEILDHDRALAGTPAAQPHGHLLLQRHRLRGPGLLELGQPGLSSPIARGHSELYAALFLYISISSRSFSCSSSQRRRSSSRRANRSRRASANVAKPEPWIQTELPAHPAPATAIVLAAWASSSRSWLTSSTDFWVPAAAPPASAWPARPSSCPARRAAAPHRDHEAAPPGRAASARLQTTCSSRATWPGRRGYRSLRCSRHRRSPRRRTRRRRRSRPALGRSRSWSASRSSSINSSSSRSSSATRGAIAGGASEKSRSRTVVDQRIAQDAADHRRPR